MKKHAAYRILVAAALVLFVGAASRAAGEAASAGPGTERGCGFWSPTTPCGGAPSGWRCGCGRGPAGRGNGRDAQKVHEVTKEDLVTADGIVLGCPTYYANIPGEMKVAIDNWSWKMDVDFTDKAGVRSPREGATRGKGIRCRVTVIVHAEQPYGRCRPLVPGRGR